LVHEIKKKNSDIRKWERKFV